MTPSGPYVDKYGQKIEAKWTGKITSDDQLKQNALDESSRLKAWDKASNQYDRYGGYHDAGWHVAGTGFYHAVSHNGIWWLITPEGYPCFYKGLDNAPALKWETTPVTGREGIFTDLPTKDGPLAAAWGGDTWGSDPGVSTLAFCAANLIRKYGVNWQDDFRQVTAHRIKAWGFSGIGKWGDFIAGVPIIPDLNHTGVPTPQGATHPDPFDPSIPQKLKLVLSAQITPHLTDPDVVAWAVGNEGAEIIGTEEIENVLVGSPDEPAKHAMVDYAVDSLYSGDVAKVAAAWGDSQDQPPSRTALYAFIPSYMPERDIEALREFYADHYYKMMFDTVKSIDPNHMYAGFWIVQGFYTDQPDWQLTAKYCDVIGFDSYDTDFNAHDVAKLIAGTAKPVICGEFSFPQTEIDRGFSDFGALSLKDEAASGKAYAHYVEVASKNPYCIGICWFQYRDEPVTGRGPGYGPALVYGENYPFGLVDITDSPKWTLIESVRAANLAATEARIKLK
jgi:hypothetical protein